MRVLRGGGFYRSNGAEGAPGPLAPDEDALTLLAAALDRAGVSGVGEGPPWALDLVGDFPTELEWALEPCLGGPVALTRSAGTPGALVEALDRAESTLGGPAVVAVVSEREAGAAAFRFEEGSATSIGSRLEAVAREGRLLDAARSVRRELADAVGPLWQGNWDALPAPESSGRSTLPAADVNGVSQGAYVPRARYLENLPSRWRFRAEVCGACGEVTFPTRGRCRSCGRADRLSPRELPRDQALIVATTVIGRGGQPTEFDAQVEALGPYGVVLAELVPGIRVTLMVAAGSAPDLRIGQRVDTQLRRLYPMEGEWRFGRKAVPAASRPPRAA